MTGHLRMALTAALICSALALPVHADDAATVAGFDARLDAIADSAASLGSLEFAASAVSSGALSATLDDPEDAATWIRENMTFDPYEGSLRGARGALFSKGGNALDRALLLAELLDAMGVDATIARGSLTDEQARALLASAAVAGSLTGDGVPSEVQAFDAGANGRVRATVSDHYWVRAALRSGTVDIDPTFPGLAFGESATEVTETFESNSLPEAAQRTVTIGVYFETDGTDGGVALSHRAALPDVAFRNISLTFDRDGARMRPQLEVGGETTSGTAIPTNGLERVWLQFVFTTGQVERRVVRDLYRRGETPDVFRRDDPIFSVVMAPGFVGTEYYRAVLSVLLGGFGDQVSSLRRVLDDEIDTSAMQADISAALAGATRDQAETALGVLALAFAHASDRAAVRVGRSLGVRPFYTEPRVIIAGAIRDGGTLEMQLDLRGNTIDAVPNVGVPATVVAAFRAVRGRVDSDLAGAITRRLTGRNAVSAADTIGAATTAGATLVTAHPGTVRRLDSLGLSDRAVRRLTEEVNELGNFAVTPNRSGDAGLAWWRVVPGTGAILGASEDGLQGAVTYLPSGFPESNGGNVRVQLADAALQLLDSVLSSAGDVGSDSAVNDTRICAAACDVLDLRRSACSDERDRTVPRLSPCLRGASTRDTGSIVAVGTSCAAQLFTFYCGAATLEGFVDETVAFELGLSPGIPVPFEGATAYAWDGCTCGDPTE